MQLRFRAAGAAQIGWFLHTPFPSSEMYRTLPVREELLRAVLKADLIGFHTYDYARHFVSACTRILGLEVRTGKGTPLLCASWLSVDSSCMVLGALVRAGMLTGRTAATCHLQGALLVSSQSAGQLHIADQTGCHSVPSIGCSRR